MSRPIVDYLIALAVCLGAAIAYRATVVPLLRPAAGEAVAVHESTVEITGPDMSGMFPADSWQLGRPKVLQASWGVLLFEHWEQVAPDRWQVKPVSVVLSRENDGTGFASSAAAADQPRDGSTVIMDAPEGAIIEFAEPLNMLSGGSPPIKGGQLVGPVHIYNEPSPEYADKALDLRARNVRIDSRQIRTVEAIDLRVSGARISGRDLTIHLAGGGTIPTGDNDSPLSVLDSMELIYLDDLSIPLPEGGLWEPLPEVVAGLPAGQPKTAGKLSVRCGGRVVFDFTDYTLRLGDGVEVRHHGGVTADDTFRCRELSVQLVDPFSRMATLDRERAEGAMKAAATIRKIEAHGTPIDANLPSVASQLKAAEMVIDVSSGSLRVAGSAESAVELTHRGFQFTVPELTYQIDLARPAELGTLVTRGQGLLRCADPELPVRNVSWQETLQVLHDAEGHHLWAAGEVRANTSDGGSVSADSVLLTFQIPDDAPATAGSPPQAGSPSDEKETAEGGLAGLRPEQLRVSGNVSFDTSMLSAEAELLQVWFEHLDPSDATAAAPVPVLQLNPATGTPLRLWVTGPDGRSDGSTIAPMAGPRVKLQGHTIQANLVLREGEVVARDLSVVKEVRLEHELQTETGPLPLVYTGDSLRLKSGAGEDLIQIAGRPARLALGDGYFEGPLVLISGTQNRVWIRDSGTFQMPSAVLPGGGAGGVGEMRCVGPPRCEFRGELTFDGQTVEIGNQVRLSARMIVGDAADLWDVLVTAPKLEMTLDRGVQVMDPTAAREAGVERVSLLGMDRDVLLTATKLSAEGVPLSRHVLSNPRLDFFAATGDLQGAGPGWYRSWAATDSKTPLRSIAPPGSLLSTHLIYNGGIEGNLARQQIEFVRGVRVGLGAVSGWDQQLDAATMTQLQLNQGTVDCDRLRIGRAPASSVSSAGSGGGARVPWEMQALGGVAFRMMSPRGLVDGTATRIAYDAGGDLFVLEGSPQRSAVVRQTSPTGQQVFNLQLPIFTLHPETLEIEAMIQGATVGALPGMNR